MTTKHTPGEWMIAENHIHGNDDNYTVLSNGGTVVANIMRHNFKKVGKSKFMSDGTLHYCEEAEANAKLIAAAPDLLEALDAVLKSYEANCPESYYKDDAVLQADYSIKKATE